MNAPEHDELWRHTLDEGADPAFAEWSRTQTLAYVRRRRRRRKLRRAGIACIGGCCLFYLATRFAAPWSAPTATRSTTRPIRSESAETSLRPIHFLTDAELLDRFPHRAVALVGSGEHQRLIFLDDPQSGR